MYCCVVALTFSRVIFAICGSVRSKSIHSGVVSMVDLLEESLQIRLELVPQLDVRDNHGRVLLAIRPPLVVTCVRILHIALPRSKCSHKRQQRRPLEPPHVQLAILGVSMLELHGAVGAAWNPPASIAHHRYLTISDNHRPIAIEPGVRFQAMGFSVLETLS
ncbi:hypothetical protein V6Z79_001654 [Aspergillus fumigatus]